MSAPAVGPDVPGIGQKWMYPFWIGEPSTLTTPLIGIRPESLQPDRKMVARMKNVGLSQERLLMVDMFNRFVMDWRGEYEGQPIGLAQFGKTQLLKVQNDCHPQEHEIKEPDSAAISNKRLCFR